MKDIDALLHEIEELKIDKMSLLKVISHDIRAPFNRIFAFLQLFKYSQDNLNNEQIGYLNSIYKEVMGGLEMIKNLNGLREIDRQAADFTLTNVLASDLLKKSIIHLEELFLLKNIEIRHRLTDMDVKVKADEFYLTKIFDNLLSNMVKYTPLGGSCEITAFAKENTFELRFTNQGEPIPENERSELFKRYKKLSIKPTQGESQSGLGLYLSKFYIDNMGGELRYNPAGNSSSFLLTLQLSKSDQQ
ncbi:MAG: HAMP domain-containing histidine kinase [Cyclobacteriaceae bacterium]|nr:HAMP domain-containing histidine kinase [Cyclobacteriaceae bacterium]